MLRASDVKAHRKTPAAFIIYHFTFYICHFTAVVRVSDKCKM